MKEKRYKIYAQYLAASILGAGAAIMLIQFALHDTLYPVTDGVILFVCIMNGIKSARRELRSRKRSRQKPVVVDMDEEYALLEKNIRVLPGNTDKNT